MNHKLDFPAGIWEAFARGQPPRLYRAGQLIYLQGTHPACFYYLQSGQVKSFIQSEDGAERVLNVYQAGSLFGEASFFDGLPRVSSAVALTGCEIVSIDRALAVREFAQNPELAMAMLRYLARTVRLLSGQVDQMAFRPARWRVANYLLTLSPAGGTLACTQDDIAAAVSASRVTVSRVLGEFAKNGWVELGYRSVTLLRPEKLEELCRQ